MENLNKKHKNEVENAWVDWQNKLSERDEKLSFILKDLEGTK